MIISCEACGTNYKLKASLISRDGSTVKCSRCQHIFVAYPPAAETETTAEYSPETGVSSADFSQPYTSTFYEDAAETEKSLDELFSEEEDQPEEWPAESSLQPGTEEDDLLADLEKEETATADAEEEADETGLSDLETGPEEELSLADLEGGQDDMDLSEPGTQPEEIDLFGPEAGSGEGQEVEEISFADLAPDPEEVSFTQIAPETEEETFRQDEEISSPEPEAETSKQEESLVDTVQEEFDLDLEFGEPEGATRAETDTDELDFSFPGPEQEEAKISSQGSQTEEISLSDLEEGPEEEVSLSDLEAGGEEDVFQPGEINPEEPAFGPEEDFAEIETNKETTGPEDLSMADSKAETDETGPEIQAGTEQEEEKAVPGFTEQEADAEASEEAEAFTENFEEDFDLDFDLDLDDEGQKTEEETDFDLDLDDLDLTLEAEEEMETRQEGSDRKQGQEEAITGPGGETAEDDLELELDIEETAEERGAGPGQMQEGPDGEDSSSFDLGLEQKSSEGESDEDFFDFDLGLGQQSRNEAGSAPDDSKKPSGEETIELDLDLDEEPQQDYSAGSPADEDIELELDFEDEQEPEAEEAGPAPEEKPGADEELDLTEVEAFLEETGEEAHEDTDTGEFSLDLETAPETGAAGSGEDDFDIDLSTMLDEEHEEEKSSEKDIELESVDGEDDDLELVEDDDYEQEITGPSPGETASYSYASESFSGRDEEDEEKDEYEGEVELTEKSYPTAAPRPAAGRSRGRGIFKTLAVLVFLALVGGGAFMYFTGRDLQDLQSLWQPAAEEAGNMRIAVSSPDYRIVENQQAGSLLVASGTVTNRYDHPRSHILVRANLLSGNGERVGSATAFCGNIFEENQLKTLEMDSINERLARRQGEGGVNSGISPGQSLPYMVVLSDLPDSMQRLTVEVVSSEKAE